MMIEANDSDDVMKNKIASMSVAYMELRDALRCHALLDAATRVFLESGLYSWPCRDGATVERILLAAGLGIQTQHKTQSSRNVMDQRIAYRNRISRARAAACLVGLYVSADSFLVGNFTAWKVCAVYDHVLGRDHAFDLSWLRDYGVTVEGTSAALDFLCKLSPKHSAKQPYQRRGQCGDMLLDDEDDYSLSGVIVSEYNTTTDGIDSITAQREASARLGGDVVALWTREGVRCARGRTAPPRREGAL